MISEWECFESLQSSEVVRAVTAIVHFFLFLLNQCRYWRFFIRLGSLEVCPITHKYFIFVSLIENALYKIAFHGRSKHIWESLMSIKEVLISVIMIIMTTNIIWIIMIVNMITFHQSFLWKIQAHISNYHNQMCC